MDKASLSDLIATLPQASIKATLQRRLSLRLRKSSAPDLTSYEVALLQQLKPRAASLLLARITSEACYASVALLLQRKVAKAALRQAQERLAKLQASNPTPSTPTPRKAKSSSLYHYLRERKIAESEARATRLLARSASDNVALATLLFSSLEEE